MKCATKFVVLSSITAALAGIECLYHCASLTLSAHVPEGYSSYLVCRSVW